MVSESWTGRKGEPSEGTGIKAASEEADSTGRVGEAKRVSHTMIVSSKEGRDNISFVLAQYAQGQVQCLAHRDAY